METLRNSTGGSTASVPGPLRGKGFGFGQHHVCLAEQLVICRCSRCSGLSSYLIGPRVGLGGAPHFSQERLPSATDHALLMRGAALAAWRRGAMLCVGGTR